MGVFFLIGDSDVGSSGINFTNVWSLPALSLLLMGTTTSYVP